MKITLIHHQHTLAKPLTRDLLQQGHDIQVLSQAAETDDYWNSFSILPCDFQDSDRLKGALKGQDVVLNLFAPMSSTEDPVSQSLNVFHGALQNDVRVIHFSSHGVYGFPLYVPINEHHPLMGKNHFTQTCIATDMLAKSFYQSFELPVVVLRLFPLFEAQTLLHFLDQLYQDTSDTDQYFDFLRVEDANACIRLLLDAGPYSGQTFNLASGSLLSTRLLKQIYAPYAERLSSQQQAEHQIEQANVVSAQDLDFWNGRQGDNASLKAFVPWQVRHTTPEALKLWLRLYFS